MHTWSPSSRQNFTRDRVSQGHGRKADSDQDLGGDESIDGLGARRDRRSDHSNGERTDEQRLADLKDVRGGRQKGAKYSLHEGEGIGNPRLGCGISETYANGGELFVGVNVLGSATGYLSDLLPPEAKKWKTC